MRPSSSKLPANPLFSPDMWLLRIACFFFFMSFGLIVTFETVLMKDNQVGESAIGSLMSVSTTIMLVGGFYFARIVDRTGRPDRLFIFGCIIFAPALFYFAKSHSTNPAAYAPYWIVRGFAWSMTVTMLPLMAVTLLGKNAGGRGYAFYRIFGSIGYCIGLLVVAQFLPQTSHKILVAAGGMSLAFIPILSCKLPSPEHKQFAPISQVLRQRDLVVLVISTFFFTAAMPAVFPFAATYARQLGADDQFISLFGAFNGLIAIIGLPLTGLAVDKVGPRTLIYIALIAQPLRAFGLSLCPTYQWMLIPQAFHIFTWAGFEIAAILFITRLTGTGGRATALSLFTAAHMLGNIIAAPLTGYLAESPAFGYNAMQQIMAGIASIGFIIFTTNAILQKKNANGISDYNKQLNPDG